MKTSAFHHSEAMKDENNDQPWAWLTEPARPRCFLRETPTLTMSLSCKNQTNKILIVSIVYI